jgi:ribosomal protein L11 methyltransferase
MTRPPLVRLGIRVRRERAEVALAALLPLLPGGAEETEPDQDEVEYAVYGPRAELPREEDIRALVGDAVIDVTRTDVPPGWERRWHRYLRPVEVAGRGRRLRVRPPWQPGGETEEGVLELVIDPGASFGAGSHATTQLCLEFLLELEPGGALCDWGSGSGVLAVAAARLGWDPVAAVEVELDALEAIRANSAANGVEVTTHWRNLAATPAPWAPTVCANLTLDLHRAIAVEAMERPPERMIASGVLEEHAGALAAAFAGHGLRETGRRVRDGWAAVLLERG